MILIQKTNKSKVSYKTTKNLNKNLKKLNKNSRNN